MQRVLYMGTGEALHITNKPFKRGGEAEIYTVMNNPTYTNHCVKVYKPTYRTKIRESKILYMIQNPPKMNDQNYMVCWPLATVYEQNMFIGFLMVRAYAQSLELFQICTSKPGQDVHSTWGQDADKYLRHTSRGVKSRLSVCNNMAFAIHNIHALNKYVIIDLKPQNILITAQGKIAMVDLDSIQINAGPIRYHAEVATPDYVPPEGMISELRSKLFDIHWDHFSMAVIIYQILFGIHPYTATFKPPFDNSTTIDDAIKNNLFVHGNKAGLVKMLPETHENFAILPPELRQLFLDAFKQGVSPPQIRPSAEQWGKTIFRLLTLPLDAQIPAFTRGIPNIVRPTGSIPSNASTRYPRPPVSPASGYYPVPPVSSKKSGSWSAFWWMLIVIVSILALYFLSR